jgi:hypothetical protein
MLQPFKRMGDFLPERDITQKKFFRFFDLPDAQPCSFVNLMLKKNRHEDDLDF